jgi:hypothetical protein
MFFNVTTFMTNSLITDFRALFIGAGTIWRNAVISLAQTYFR